MFNGAAGTKTGGIACDIVTSLLNDYLDVSSYYLRCSGNSPYFCFFIIEFREIPRVLLAPLCCFPYLYPQMQLAGNPISTPGIEGKECGKVPTEKTEKFRQKMGVGFLLSGNYFLCLQWDTCVRSRWAKAWQIDYLFKGTWQRRNCGINASIQLNMTRHCWMSLELSWGPVQWVSIFRLIRTYKLDSFALMLPPHKISSDRLVTSIKWKF